MREYSTSPCVQHDHNERPCPKSVGWDHLVLMNETNEGHSRVAAALQHEAPVEMENVSRIHSQGVIRVYSKSGERTVL